MVYVCMYACTLVHVVGYCNAEDGFGERQINVFEALGVLYP